MRKKLLGLTVLTASAIAALAATMAFAVNIDGQGPGISYVTWNGQDKPACGTAGNAWSYKVDPVASGTYGPVTITVTGSTFSWVLNDTANYDMGAIAVKGGPSQVKVYTYDYAGSGLSDSGSGLTAALNPNSGKPYGLSHLLICLDPKGGGNN